jgi:HlyD family secretion protein
VTTHAITMAAAGTNGADSRKNSELTKPVQVVFVVHGDHVDAVPVQTGIEDDNYIEIISGLKEGDQVISGGSKTINRELQDGSKVTAGAVKAETPGSKP